MLVGPVRISKSMVRESAAAPGTNPAQEHLSDLVRIPLESLKAEFGCMTKYGEAQLNTPICFLNYHNFLLYPEKVIRKD